MQQLVFNLAPNPIFDEKNFLVSSCNREAWTWINEWPNWPIHILAIHGDKGCGKTHVAHIWQQKSQAIFITQDHIASLSPLEAIANHSCFILDNADPIINEEWLFHFYNLIQERKGYFLLCSRTPPEHWAIKLADLNSRLRAIASLAVAPPDDTILEHFLLKLFTDRGLRVGPDVISYLLNRMERSFDAAQKLVQTLDHHALVKHRQLTLPLIREVISDPMAPLPE